VWKLKLRIKPEGEPEFEADVKQRYGQLSRPMVGSSVVVPYDPDDHTKVAIDQSEAAQLDSVIDTVTSGSSAVAANPALAAPLADLMRAAVADPQASREQMREQATAAGASAFALSPQGLTPPASAPPADPVDQIAKLADLRDRGALTDAEFEEQKKRILGT
jgi:hypothetical protein